MPYELDHATDLSVTSIDTIAPGNNVIVGMVTGRQVKVYQMLLAISPATTIIFKDGTSNLTGNINVASITLDYTGEPWFITSASSSFDINLATASQMSGTVHYIQD